MVSVLRSGWLTTGPRVRQFEEAFAAAVGARHAVGVNSATAALHLAAEAIELRTGQAVLVPTMTFAATAEIVRYLGAIPILVDCEPENLHLDLQDARRKLEDLGAGRLPEAISQDLNVVGTIPVHVGGVVQSIGDLQHFCAERGLWMVEDAAHAFPAAARSTPEDEWTRCGEGTSAVTCFSFYANKTMTTGEGGMAVTDDVDLVDRMRTMSLHGLSKDPWGRQKSPATWDYQIVAPGFKYNLTDIAAALGIRQLARAEDMRRCRETIARDYIDSLNEVEEIDLPPVPANCVHAWHLFPIRLKLDRLSIDRDTFLAELRRAGVESSVHWRPLHLHPYYQETFGWTPERCPVATREWRRLVSLPLFPSMSPGECEHVTSSVIDICRHFSRPSTSARRSLPAAALGALR